MLYCLGNVVGHCSCQNKMSDDRQNNNGAGHSFDLSYLIEVELIYAVSIHYHDNKIAKEFDRLVKGITIIIVWVPHQICPTRNTGNVLARSIRRKQ